MENRTLSHYRVLEKIGAGGMGIVYRAHDERLDRDVALKVLPQGLLSDEGARRRFRKEALALSKLNHPNIETVHDFDTQEGVDFLVMEYLSGETLAQRLAGGPLPEKEVAALGRQIASALEGAHERGVVHRDLKPGNILVTGRGQAKVLDFGLAMLLRPDDPRSQTVTRSQELAVVGTLPYMAPEQLRGEKVDPRSDLYAAGAVLYEMATGRRPFPEAHAPLLIDAILNRAPEPPSHLNPMISAGLEGVILKALEKKPEHRQQSARDLERDLEMLGRPGPWAARRARGLFGTRARAIAAALGMALVLALGALVSRLLHRSNESRTVLMKEHRRARAVGEAPVSRIATLAVLPMVNLSGDSAQDYFADGLTEELIAALTKIGTLHVISRDSVMRYKNTRKPIPQIAKELGVEDVIESSVRRSEGRVRVTAQLVEAATNRNLWAEMYDRDLRDVLSIQGEVARAIAQEIRVNVTPQEHARLGAPRAVSLEAHDAYLRGRFHLNSFDVDGGRKAMDYFKQALGIDPNYALAWVGLADSYILLSEMFLPPNEALPRAKAAAEKALEIDGTVAEAYASLAYVRSRLDWDWAGTETAYHTVFDLRPGDASAHHQFGIFLVAMGRFDEATAELERARELEPLAPIIAVNAVWPLYYGRKYDRAVDRLQELLQVEPEFAPAYGLLGWTYQEQGDYPKAITALEKCGALSPGTLEPVAYLARAYAASGRTAEAQKLLEELTAASKQRYLPAYDIAMIYGALRERDRAFAWLEKAYAGRDEWLVWAGVDPRADNLRSDPRFLSLLQRLNLRSP